MTMPTPGQGPATETPPPEDGTPAPQPQPAAPPVPPEPTPPPQGDEPASVDDLREQLQAERDRNRQLTDENAKRRIAERDTRQRMEQVLQALGLGEQPADPQAVQRQVEQLQGELATSRMQYAVAVAAGDAGGDVSLMFPWLQSQGLLTEVDPSDPGAVRAVVDEALKAKPQLRLTPPAPGPTRSGADDPPAGNGQGDLVRFTRAEIARRKDAGDMKWFDDNQEAIDRWLAAGAPE